MVIPWKKIIIGCIVGLAGGLLVAALFPSTFVWVRAPFLKVVSLKFWLCIVFVIGMFSIMWVNYKIGLHYTSGISVGFIIGYSLIFFPTLKLLTAVSALGVGAICFLIGIWLSEITEDLYRAMGLG